MPKTTRFDAADYLDSEERQVAYITAALETGDADFVRDALGIVAKARGMGEIAKNAGLNRESLYKALGETGNPEFATVMRIVRALGLTLSARPTTRGHARKQRRVALHLAPRSGEGPPEGRWKGRGPRRLLHAR
jgi:probable addiction module antidote protein